ncbi:MAG: WD40/YVTN/BNR-like repeat-containing protein, partial [Acidimicrobiales bacterium]
LGADGYHVAFDPEDPDISYLEWQEGNVMRHDRRTMELHDIQPQAEPTDDPDRWNWDTPILISPHEHARIFVASQRVWRSDDRGDSWSAISGDLTRGRNRYELPTGDRVWSVDALYDHMAMSAYATITTLSESPVSEGTLYAGTDDGVVQVTDDGGGTWRESGQLPGLPAEAFINDVEASRHDGASVFVAADDHKSGDYAPYLYESTDRGATWRIIRGDLPEGTIVWTIEQDHLNPDLLFVGAEHGLYASVDRGDHWHKLSKDVPTISFRSLAIQRRDDDLVASTFGRGIFVLDDYSPLRTLGAAALEDRATLFPVRDAWSYVPYRPMQARGEPTLGSTSWRAPNPGFGATFTYHLAEAIETGAKQRRTSEKPLDESADDVPFPGWETLYEEHLEFDPTALLIIRDAEGSHVRSIVAECGKGLHRTSWDLRLAPPDPVTLETPKFQPPWTPVPKGPLAPAGPYSVELVQLTDAGPVIFSGPERFEVRPAPALDGVIGLPEVDEFRYRTATLARRAAGSAKWIESARERVRHLRIAIAATPGDHHELHSRLEAAHRHLEDLRKSLVGDPVQEKFFEPTHSSISAQVNRVAVFHWDSTAPPSVTQRKAVDRASDAFDAVHAELSDLIGGELAQLALDVDVAGGPWTPR